MVGVGQGSGKRKVYSVESPCRGRREVSSVTVHLIPHQRCKPDPERPGKRLLAEAQVAYGMLNRYVSDATSTGPVAQKMLDLGLKGFQFGQQLGRNRWIQGVWAALA